jgi:hypothetical protein
MESYTTELIKQAAASARQREDQVRGQLEQAGRIREFWERLSDEADSPASLLLTLRRSGPVLDLLRGKSEQLEAAVQEARTEAEAKATEAARTFIWSFPTAIRDAAISPDKTSRHPKYTFREGFIRLDIDDRAFTAKISPRDGQEIMVGMDVPVVVQKLVAEEARLFRRQFQADQLLRSVHTAYTACLKAERAGDGEEVPLRRLVNRLAKNLNRFAADEFNVDFAQLIKSGKVVIDGLRMHLNHTRHARVGMLLHGLEEGGYVGFVSFKREEQRNDDRPA